MDIEINIVLVVVVVLAIFKVKDGYKKGMVKEIISLVTMAILCAVLALLTVAVGSYRDGEIFHMAIAVAMLIILGILHHLLELFFFSVKLVAKLPVVSFANKLLGVVFGLIEVVFLIWLVYTLIMMLDLGSVEEIIISYTQESEILTWFYRRNYLAYLVESIAAKYPVFGWR